MEKPRTLENYMLKHMDWKTYLYILAISKWRADIKNIIVNVAIQKKASNEEESMPGEMETIQLEQNCE